MKVLSIKQPWAELIFLGKKKIEMRKWNTKFRGLFLIHASRNPDEKAMKKFGFSEKELLLGKIVGKSFLVDVKNYNEVGNKEFEKDKGKHLAEREWGSFGFILENAKRVKPINIKGKLGFWEFDPLKEI